MLKNDNFPIFYGRYFNFETQTVFQKLQEILYVIGTKIFQIDLLEAEKIGSKDGNSA